MSLSKRNEFLARKELLEKIEKQQETGVDEDSPWRKFEKEVANLFEENGWKVRLGPGSNDGGKDIVIKRKDEIYLVQCKHYRGTKYVSPKHVRDFQGAIDLYEKENNMKVKGIFITSGKTTSLARKAAETLGIELWDKWNRKDKIFSF